MFAKRCQNHAGYLDAPPNATNSVNKVHALPSSAIPGALQEFSGHENKSSDRMPGGKVIARLHLHKPRNGALEFKGPIACKIEVMRR